MPFCGGMVRFSIEGLAHRIGVMPWQLRHVLRTKKRFDAEVCERVLNALARAKALPERKADK